MNHETQLFVSDQPLGLHHALQSSECINPRRERLESSDEDPEGLIFKRSKVTLSAEDQRRITKSFRKVCQMRYNRVSIGDFVRVLEQPDQMGYCLGDHISGYMRYDPRLSKITPKLEYPTYASLTTMCILS